MSDLSRVEIFFDFVEGISPSVFFTLLPAACGAFGKDACVEWIPRGSAGAGFGGSGGIVVVAGVPFDGSIRDSGSAEDINLDHALASGESSGTSIICLETAIWWGTK